MSSRMTARKSQNTIQNRAAVKPKAAKPKAAKPGRKQPAPRTRPPYFSKLAYDVGEAADALGISVPTVNRLIYAVPAELKSMKIGYRRVVPVSAIMKYMESRLAAEDQKYPGSTRRRGRMGKSA